MRGISMTFLDGDAAVDTRRSWLTSNSDPDHKSGFCLQLKESQHSTAVSAMEQQCDIIDVTHKHKWFSQTTWKPLCQRVILSQQYLTIIYQVNT